MTLIPRLDILGAALADASRARMLCELMDGRAFTGKELAAAAGITAQTASAHLKQLQAAGLITAVKSGRCVYHRIATGEVAAALESLSVIAPSDHVLRGLQRRGARTGMLTARSCYDHLAGRLGVAVAEALEARGALVMEAGAFRAQTPELWVRLGVTLPGRPGAAPFARACLDWTERRAHIAGPAGRQILNHAFDRGWLRRRIGARGLIVTRKGHAAFRRILDLDTAMLEAADG